MVNFSSKRICLNQDSKAGSSKSSFSSTEANALHLSSNLAFKLLETPSYFFEPNISTLTSSNLVNREFSFTDPVSIEISLLLNLFEQASASALPLKEANSDFLEGGFERTILELEVGIPPKLISSSGSCAKALVAADTASLRFSLEEDSGGI